MGKVEMVMPKMGESIMEGTILAWLKQVGDPIDQDESVLEVATDKVDTEIPSEHAGVLAEILANEGDVVEVGKPIAVIETNNGAPSEPNGQTIQVESPVPTFEEEVVPDPDPVAENFSTKSSVAIPGDRFYSPLVKSIAKQEHISSEELGHIPGTGKKGRLTKKDILHYLKLRTQESPPRLQAEESPSLAPVSGEDEIIEMDRMRKMIAE